MSATTSIATRDAHPVAPGDLDAIRALHTAAFAVDGHDALGEAAWRDLEGGGQAGSAGVFATEGTRLVGYAHAAPSDSFSPPHWAVGTVVHPEMRSGSIRGDLLAAVVTHIRGAGGGRAVLWIVEPSPADDEAAAAAGFRPSRALLQMRVPLPLAETPAWPPGVTVRAFEPGPDDDAWLRVNNRAFSNHPEQGGWIAATLQTRIAEPWFDAAGFLLAFDAAGLAGFCWTKVHPAAAGAAALGEIFAIGVDPDRQGTGLGRALVVAGLASLSARGIGTGLLYVDAANAAAVGLYRALGFVEHRRDRAYERSVA